MAGPEFLRLKEKDRQLELQKAENARNMIMIQQYEIAFKLKRPVEEIEDEEGSFKLLQKK